MKRPKAITPEILERATLDQLEAIKRGALALGSEWAVALVDAECERRIQWVNELDAAVARINSRNRPPVA